MEINPSEIEEKKKVGHWGKFPVLQVSLKGGLHMIMCAKNGKFDTLGLGSHPALARHIAKKKSNDEIVYSELSKSEYIAPEYFQDLIPYYEQLTDIFRNSQGL